MTLKKEIEKTQINGNKYRAHDLAPVFCNVHTTQQSTNSMQPIKIPVAFFIELEQIIVNYYKKLKILNSQSNLENKKTS